MKPRFFANPEAFRAWLASHHESATELLVGFYKKGSGIPSITWPESVDAALSFGWIDGVRKNIDERSYAIRFTPRKSRSIWSAINTARVQELTKAGLMHPSGVKAFEARSAERSAIYAYERKTDAVFETVEEQRFRDRKTAWEFFQSQPPSYRKTATHWVVSAKKPETRTRRLATLIEDSENGKRLKHLTRP